MSAQTPTTPDLSFVKELDPGVAYAVLIVVALAILIPYVGPGLKARFTPKPPEPAKPPDPPAAPPSMPQQVTQQIPALATAMGHSDTVSQQFLDHVLRQLRDLEIEKDRVERENRELRSLVDQLRDQVRWQQRGMR